MGLKKRIMASCAACVVVMAVVMGLCLCYWVTEKEELIQWAENSSQLELFIEFPSGTERINSWQNEEGNYLFFLPAGAADCRITFGNLKENSIVSLDGQVFDRDDDLRTFLDELISSKEAKILSLDGEGSESAICVVFFQSENLPAMFIDTASGTLENIFASKEIKEEASLRLLDSKGENCCHASIEYIRGRGNSTWVFYDKKSYQIKLHEKNKLLHMPAAQKWILLANIVDDTLIKNEIVFRYAENYTTVPSVKGEFIDLYINGDYAGNYYLCEKIEVGGNRLDITDLEALTKKANRKNNYEEASLYISENGCIKAAQGLNNPADITGGYLLEHIPIEDYETEINAFQTNMGHCYAIKSPSQATVEQAEYICGLFNEMEEAMAQEDMINPATGKHVSEYLDLDSWTSKYVMEQVFSDPDVAVGRSMYLYKDSDKVDPLIYSGPMWDYDRALGSYGIQRYSLDDPKQLEGYDVYGEYLMLSSKVTEMVYQRFKDDMVPYIENIIQADIYELNQRIKTSAEMDSQRWNQLYGYYVDRDAAVNYLTYFLKEKSDYLKNVWLGEDDYCTLTFLDYYGDDYEVYRIKKGDRLAKAPSIATYVAVFAGWYKQGTPIPYVPDLPVLEDAVYESRWIDLAVILQNGLGGAEKDLSQVDPEFFEKMADILREMQEGNAVPEILP